MIHRQHLDTCASLCANYNQGFEAAVEFSFRPPTRAKVEMLLEGPCDIEHSCWCPDGGLSYDEWRARHTTQVKWAHSEELRGGVA